ncbi:MAG: nucleoside phosphorylase [Prevotellaceae bacterium]|jgi:uridine phosphorylase|nr:nucleoside phosphorylase [Prevotellaceae bacterium]
MQTPIAPSELIINDDGSIFHLHLLPEDLADTVILVGDPGRVAAVSARFSRVEVKKSNREFVSHTGVYKGTRLTVTSTGIGTDNIDIVLNELDALANINLKTRLPKEAHRTLRLVRLGTSGALQPDIAPGAVVCSHVCIGFDGLLNFYARRNEVSRLDYEAAFLRHTAWSELCARPYFVENSGELIKLFAGETVEGMTISAPGFYGPQGRVLRLPLADPALNEKIGTFRVDGKRIANFEMEGSAIAGLSKLLNHKSLTMCTIIDNRAMLSMSVDYKKAVDNMVAMALEKLT